ncbi:MAG: hypothetical protein MUC84_11360, partial [Solirubrobacteraceae bacterium]|nr:hypothetical protein [Solirubrobacteraceae bacterium]
MWGSLAALNHWVLGFRGWPEPDEPGIQRLVVADATPAAAPATGRPEARLTVDRTGGVPATFPAAGPAAGEPDAAPVEPRPGTGAEGGLPVGGQGGVLAPERGPSAGGDPDGDGVPTGVERVRGTNPASADTDNDGQPDAWEVRNGLDPRDFRDGAADSDGDGVPNRSEFRLGDDP